MPDEALAFEYDLRPLPRGPLAFTRWRWELWHGTVLRAAGWRTSPGDAELALCRAASYWAHAALGVHALRPERARASRSFAPGAMVRVDCGGFFCVLAPRAEVALEVAS